MHQKPSLQLIGPARDVILGIVSWGDDIDGFCIPFELVFAEDAQENEQVRPSISNR